MESSLPSSSSLPAGIDRCVVSNTAAAEDQATDGDDGSNSTPNANEHASLTLSNARASSCGDFASARRRRMEQVDRGQLLWEQFQQQQQQRQQDAPRQQEGEEREIVIPATSTSMSRKSLFVLRPIHKYADLVCIGISVLAYLLETTMNAALAIFGIGVGVGLVLGDSFRATLPLLPSAQGQQQQQQQMMTNATTPAGAQAGIPAAVPNLLPAQ